jgi:hypothetical protein
LISERKEMLAEFLRGAFARLRPVFTPLERRLIEELVSRLKDDAAAILRRQIQMITFVQRLCSGREVNCYPMKSGRPFHDPNYRFPCADLDLRLGRISFYDPRDSCRYLAEFHLCEGFFFSIWFDRSPASAIRPEELVIEAVNLLADPMLARNPPALEEIPIGQADLPLWVLRLLVQMPQDPLRVFRALDREQRLLFMQKIDCGLPADYLQLTEKCEGFSAGRWTVMGLSQVHAVNAADAIYYVVAEEGGSHVLAIRRGDSTGALHRFSLEGERIETLKSSMEQAMSPPARVSEGR